MDDHSSGTSVAGRLARPTRRTVRKRTRGPKPPVLPIRSCSRWGLPCRSCLQARGALLPHPFTLTSWFCNELAVCFLWHFPWGRPRRALPGTVFPWSPDFPPLAGFPQQGAVIQPSDAHSLYSRNGGLRKQLGHESYICGRGVRVALRP